MDNGKIRRTIVTDLIMGDTCFRFGRLDAIQGNNCQPLVYFREADSIVHYTLGWQEVNGETEKSKACLAEFDSDEIDKTYVPVDYEICFVDDALEIWLPVIELQVVDHLKESRRDVAQSLSDMRGTPGLIVACNRAKFRYTPAQEAPNALAN